MEAEKTDSLTFKSINDLITEKTCFVVRSYQRGYRWDETQVNRLLDDLYEFAEQKKHTLL
jgi:uncharacterized protein with ParB-like and HNH nuclease domain